MALSTPIIIGQRRAALFGIMRASVLPPLQLIWIRVLSCRRSCQASFKACDWNGTRALGGCAFRLTRRRSFFFSKMEPIWTIVLLAMSSNFIPTRVET
ncbi:hypothetical protein LINPERPRIM_LOCUS21667 [Linum perenne]